MRKMISADKLALTERERDRETKRINDFKLSVNIIYFNLVELALMKHEILLLFWLDAQKMAKKKKKRTVFVIL